ncbi:unnamed protein product [Ixodes pacificus]
MRMNNISNLTQHEHGIGTVLHFQISKSPCPPRVHPHSGTFQVPGFLLKWKYKEYPFSNKI